MLIAEYALWVSEYTVNFPMEKKVGKIVQAEAFN